LLQKCLQKHVIERKIEKNIKVLGRRTGRIKQLVDDLKEMKGYWKLKKASLCRTPGKTCYERRYGTVVKQTTEYGNILLCTVTIAL